MLRIVLDTSSLVSYVLTRGDIMRRIIGRWRAGDFTVLSSPATRDELAGVLARPSIRRLSAVPLEEFVRGMERFTDHMPGALDVCACRDPKDDKFLACALEGQADYLVTSDRDLLDMRRFEGTAIVNPGQFLLALELHAMAPAEMLARFGRQVLTDIHQAISLDPDTLARLAQALDADPPVEPRSP